MPSIAPSPKSTSLDTRVLETIRLLLQELGSRRALQSLSLQASLERDLGLGSLERVELLDRLEKEFNRKFPDEVLTQAETPADLVKALGIAPSESRAKPQSSTLLGPVGHSTPSSVGEDARGRLRVPALKSLNEVLEFYAERDSAKAHIHLYGEDQRPHLITYGQLQTGARAVASGLIARGLGLGETVSLMLPRPKTFSSLSSGFS